MFLFQAEGAEVRIAGSNWDGANAEAVKFVENEKGAFLVHPFDQETWYKFVSTNKMILK